MKLYNCLQVKTQADRYKQMEDQFILKDSGNPDACGMLLDHLNLSEKPKLYIPLIFPFVQTKSAHKIISPIDWTHCFSVHCFDGA